MGYFAGASKLKIVSKVELLFIIEITTEEQMEKAREQISLSGPGNGRDNSCKLTSIYKLHDFVKNKGDGSRAYYMEVSTV